MSENNHTFVHPEVFPGLTVVKISDAKVRKPMSLLISSHFVCSLSGCKVPGMDTAEPYPLGFASSQLRAVTPHVQAARN